MLAGELNRTQASVALKGRPLASYAPRELALHRAVLSQSTHVAFPFTVGEVVRMGAGDRHGRAIDELAERALADVDLSAFSERIITTLSGGEQQRAHFARVLVQLACGEAAHGPGLLLLDEPTASLDLKHQLDHAGGGRTLRAARRRRGGDPARPQPRDAAADRIVVLDGGRVAADGAPAETVTDDLLARVFKVSSAVSRTPPAGRAVRAAARDHDTALKPRNAPYFLAFPAELTRKRAACSHRSNSAFFQENNP